MTGVKSCPRFSGWERSPRRRWGAKRSGPGASGSGLRHLLRRHSVRVKLASQRDMGTEGMDLSYRVLLRDPSRSRDLLQELRATEGVSAASLYHREDESEI